MELPIYAGRQKQIYIIIAILVAVTIAGSVVLYIWASSFLTSDKSTPVIEAELEERPDGFLINITQVDVQLPYHMWRWRLVDDDGIILQEGKLMSTWQFKSAWQLNLAYRNANGTPAGLVSVHSVFGNNTKMNPGDQICFSEELFPASISGLRLELVFEPTNETTASLPLVDAVWVSSHLPTLTTPIIPIEGDANLSFGPGEPLSHNPVVYLSGGKAILEWEMTLSVVNTGDKSYQNVTFFIDTGGNASESEEIAILEIPAKTTTTFTRKLTHPPSIPESWRRSGPVEWTLRFSDDYNVTILVGKITVEGIRPVIVCPSFSLTLPLLFLALLTTALAQKLIRIERS